MEYLMAPLEGITYPEYRLLHARMFPGAAEYYAPFVSPGGGKLTEHWLASRFPDREAGFRLIPQLMANDPVKFCETARLLKDLGFDEVNLNAGCPSGTVFPKHKGAGMLSDLDSLASFLDGAFCGTGMKISVKTRMGVESEEEYPRIAEIYSRYPFTRIIVHARARSGFYKSEPDAEGFAKAFSEYGPACYNGNIFSKADEDRIKGKVPELTSIMTGRGTVANPALIRMLQGGAPLELCEFTAFHDELIEAYLASGIGAHGVLQRMKELWYYNACLFPGGDRELKGILKAKTLEEYRPAFGILTRNVPFDGSASFKQH